MPTTHTVNSQPDQLRPPPDRRSSGRAPGRRTSRLTASATPSPKPAPSTIISRVSSRRDFSAGGATADRRRAAGAGGGGAARAAVARSVEVLRDASSTSVDDVARLGCARTSRSPPAGGGSTADASFGQLGAHRRAPVAREVAELHPGLLNLAAQGDGALGLRQSDDRADAVPRSAAAPSTRACRSAPAPSCPCRAITVWRRVLPRPQSVSSLQHPGRPSAVRSSSTSSSTPWLPQIGRRGRHPPTARVAYRGARCGEP